MYVCIVCALCGYSVVPFTLPTLAESLKNISLANKDEFSVSEATLVPVHDKLQTSKTESSDYACIFSSTSVFQENIYTSENIVLGMPVSISF